ncbi:hypothetical protein AA313_de0204949 [Arthrobotrys entomopaga]|nr:hypothetical protein AA313_de0204949 [Arthrobotrys entomopaga]
MRALESSEMVWGKATFTGASFRPRRRRSFSGTDAERPFTFKKENMLKERPIFTNSSGLGPSNFRNKQDPSPFVLGNRPTDKRPGGKPFQVRALGQVPQARQPRGSPGTNQKGGPWGAAGGLVVDQDAFFKHMAEKTGLTSKPFTAFAAKSTSDPNAGKSMAKPMPSAKDMTPENLSAKVGKVQQATQSKFPTGFIPPHLRHIVKKAEAPKIALDAVPRPATEAEKPEPALEMVRLPSPKESSETIVPVAGTPEIIASEVVVAASPPSPIRLPSPSNSQKSCQFARKFFELVLKPLWGHLIQDYENSAQQISFLSTYYFSHPEEWREIEENGPPSAETIVTLTRKFMDEASEREEAELKAQSLLVDESVEAVTQIPPEDKKTWWRVDIPEEEIDEWAEKLQESHRDSFLKALKQRIKEEKDVEQARQIYGKIRSLLRVNRRIAGTVSPAIQDSVEIVSPSLDEVNLGSNVYGENMQGVPSVHADEPLAWQPKRTGSLEKFLREFPNKREKMSTVQEETSIRKRPATPVRGYGSVESKPDAEEHGRLSHPTTPAPPIEGATTSLKPRETSGERREREKRERMAEIERTFALNKAVGQSNFQRTDGHQEMPPEETGIKDAITKKYKLKSVSDCADISIDCPTLIAMAEPPKIEINDSTFGSDDETHKDVASAIAYLKEVTDPSISRDEIELILAQNRKLLPKLVEERPWHLNIGIPSIVPGAKPISIQMKCTNKLPADLILELRKLIKGDEWGSVSEHPDFRATLYDSTRVFYSKMARIWGPTFAYGV